MSPEELSQELLQAILTKDAKRAEALTRLESQPRSTRPAALRGAENAGTAPPRHAQRAIEAGRALKFTPDAKWGSLQLSAPQTTPADAMGARDDLVLHKTGTILVIDGKDGKDPKTLPTGELIQIGRAWKLVDGPNSGGHDSAAVPVIPENLRELVARLNDIDQKEMPNPPTREALAVYNGKLRGGAGGDHRQSSRRAARSLDEATGR